MHTQDDIGLESRSESAFVSSDASDLLSTARRLLRDVLPQSVRQAHEWAASLLRLDAPAEQLLGALHLQAGVTPPHHMPPDTNVSVHVHELYLSVAGVVGLIDDGARPDSAMPLHTGRYVQVMVANASRTLATFWLPLVPVFRVSPRLMT